MLNPASRNFQMLPELLVSASNTLAGGPTAPEMVMFMPAGKHTITAEYKGKPETLEVTVAEADATTLQASFNEILAAGGPEPSIGFDHKPGPAAFWPKGFKWQAGDKPGIYVMAEWTPGGVAAVTAAAGQRANYRFFSPTFCFDKGRITGLPKRGEIGSLVNNPAFRQIAAVAASDQSQPSNAMTEAEIAALKAELEASKTASAAAAAEVKKMKETVAATAVSQAVEDGKIAAQDTAKQDRYKALLVADPANKSLLDDLPVKFAIKAADTGGTAPLNAAEKEVSGEVVEARAWDIFNGSKVSGNRMSWREAFTAAQSQCGCLASDDPKTAIEAA